MSMATQTILDGTLTPRTWVQYQMWFHQRMSELMMLAVAFSIPLATTAAEVLLCLYLYFYISALGFGQKLRLIFSNRISQCFLLMCGLMLVGMAWSSGSWNETLRGLSKHREFLYMPLFLTSLRKEWVRTWGIRMFMVGATTLLALSYIEWIFGLDLELASTVGLGEGASAGYVIFKDRIVHSLLIAFLAFLYANLFLDKPAWRP